MRRLVATLVALTALPLAGCSGGDDEPLSSFAVDGTRVWSKFSGKGDSDVTVETRMDVSRIKVHYSCAGATADDELTVRVPLGEGGSGCGEPGEGSIILTTAGTDADVPAGAFRIRVTAPDDATWSVAVDVNGAAEPAVESS